jgi:hypothetical protein
LPEISDDPDKYLLLLRNQINVRWLLLQPGKGDGRRDVTYYLASLSLLPEHLQ